MLLARSRLVVLAGAYVAAPADPLRVMRAAPQDVAEQNAVVIVTFVKVAAVDEVWSGLKLVRRRTDR